MMGSGSGSATTMPAAGSTTAPAGGATTAAAGDTSNIQTHAFGFNTKFKTNLINFFFI